MLHIFSRYSAVRRQGELVDGVEPRVLDYTSQQAKVGYFFIFARISKDMLETTSPIPQVLPPLALAVGLHLAADAVWEMYNTVQVSGPFFFGRVRKISFP